MCRRCCSISKVSGCTLICPCFYDNRACESNALIQRILFASVSAKPTRFGMFIGVPGRPNRLACSLRRQPREVEQKMQAKHFTRIFGGLILGLSLLGIGVM